MFVYKPDVSTLRALQPQRMQQVLGRSGAAAVQNVKDASHGVVVQTDGQIVGVLAVSDTAGVPHVLGAYSAHDPCEQAHQCVVREMLEMLLSELSGALMTAKVPTGDVCVFEQCGFVVESFSDACALMAIRAPGTA